MWEFISFERNIFNETEGRVEYVPREGNKFPHTARQRQINFMYRTWHSRLYLLKSSARKVTGDGVASSPSEILDLHPTRLWSKFLKKRDVICRPNLAKKKVSADVMKILRGDKGDVNKPSSRENQD